MFDDMTSAERPWKRGRKDHQINSNCRAYHVTTSLAHVGSVGCARSHCLVGRLLPQRSLSDQFGTQQDINCTVVRSTGDLACVCSRLTRNTLPSVEHCRLHVSRDPRCHHDAHGVGEARQASDTIGLIASESLDFTL